MFDHLLRGLKDNLLRPLARGLQGVHPTTITVVAFAVGVVGVVLLAWQMYWAGLVCWLLNRVLDGLDGMVARLTNQQSDLGGYIDILLDFAIYGMIPVAIVAGAPRPAGYLALGVLLATFYINAASWMYLSAILEKRKHGASAQKELTTVTMPAGLVGGTETVVFFCLFIILPQYVVWLYGLMAAMVTVSIGQRLVWAIRHLD